MNLIVDHIFNTSIQAQFKSFYDGFHWACGGYALDLVYPGELDGIICGS